MPAGAAAAPGSGAGWARRAVPGRAAAVAVAVLLSLVAACGTGRGMPAEGTVHRTTAQPVAALRAAAALEPCPAPGGSAPTGSGSLLPDLTLQCLGDGDPVALRRLAGTPTVLTLWASWCAPCRQELPAFQRLHVDAGRAVRVLGVVTEDPVGSALSLAAGTGVHFPSVVDDTGRLKRALGRSLLPTTVLVRADGGIAQVYTGPPLHDDTLRRLVRDRLGVTVR